MTLTPQQRQRLEELLFERATASLEVEAHEELEELLEKLPPAQRERFSGISGAEGWELAAAAVQLALYPGKVAEEVPAGLEDRLLAQAQDFFAGREGAAASTSDTVTVHPPKLSQSPAAPAPVVDLTRRRGRFETGSRLGWWAAAAAALMAVVGWWSALVPNVETGTAVGPVEASKPSLEEVRAATDAVVVPWQGTEDPAAAGAGGEVLWSDSLQAGYMVFRGLKANDPAIEQYQLWIFDVAQDERYPVDGGVFDVAAGEAEVVVLIDAKLRIADPTLFAVTVEKPGGVVVSSRERLVLLAQPV